MCAAVAAEEAMEKDSVDVYPVALLPTNNAVEVDEGADPYVTVDPYVIEEQEDAEEEVEELIVSAVEDEAVEEGALEEAVEEEMRKDRDVEYAPEAVLPMTEEVD